jgi:hypothetical protein
MLTSKGGPGPAPGDAPGESEPSSATHGAQERALAFSRSNSD